MPDSPEKNLIAAFAEAWGESAPALLGEPSALGLLSLRDVWGEEVKPALAVAVTWSAAFAASCSGGLPGVLVCLFKTEDCEEIERRAKQHAAPPADGRAKPGIRALVGAVLSAATKRLGGDAAVSFDAAQFIDLTADESKLAAVVGDAAWLGTLSLTLGAGGATQALVIYAPHGSLGATNPKAQASPAAAPPGQSNVRSTDSPTPPLAAPPGRNAAPRAEGPRNIDRLLDVELEIIVRFGVAHLPLRELVRLGNGSMIELDRAVDEPVELLVNGRHLARGSVVVVDGYYGVRITEIGEAADRPLSLVAGG
jgi:flagellar motor switch protein FliN